MFDYDAVDPMIRPLVRALRHSGIETTESCQGGEGHGGEWPWVTFNGGEEEGNRAMSLAERLVKVWMMEKCWEVLGGQRVGEGFWRIRLYPLTS